MWNDKRIVPFVFLFLSDGKLSVLLCMIWYRHVDCCSYNVMINIALGPSFPPIDVFFFFLMLQICDQRNGLEKYAPFQKLSKHFEREYFNPSFLNLSIFVNCLLFWSFLQSLKIISERCDNKSHTGHKPWSPGEKSCAWLIYPPWPVPHADFANQITTFRSCHLWYKYWRSGDMLSLTSHFKISQYTKKKELPGLMMHAWVYSHIILKNSSMHRVPGKCIC